MVDRTACNPYEEVAETLHVVAALRKCGAVVVGRRTAPFLVGDLRQYGAIVFLTLTRREKHNR